MSLVYEALQKAAREKNRFAAQPAAPFQSRPPAPTPVAVAVVPQRTLGPWIAVISLGVIIVVVAVVLVLPAKPVVLSGPPPLTENIAVVPAAVPPAPATPAPVAPAPTVATPVAENATANGARYKLTGIMKLGEEYSAVINGHVFTRGQFVDGAIVKAVEFDRVTFTENGREFVVRLF